MFLSPSDLCTLTGYRQAASQRGAGEEETLTRIKKYLVDPLTTVRGGV